MVVETVQMLSYLGSGDINDAIQNSIGASIGYAAYKLGSNAKTIKKQLVISGFSALFIFAAVWGCCEVIETALTKRRTVHCNQRSEGRQWKYSSTHSTISF